VKSFSDIGAAGKTADVDVKVDAKETGQRKTINGFNASELVMTMEVDSPQAQQMGKMQMEMNMWLSPDVPGYQQMHDFYQRNLAKFPWTAMAGGANSGMQKAMVDMQKAMASMHGIQVETVMRMKSAAGARQMQQGMAAACPQMQALIAQGGPAAAAIKQQYDRVCGGAGPGAASAGSSNVMVEMTMDSSDFSTALIPDSVFAIPAGFTKTDK
jgi:GTP1/Obg family GTP-binding protein